MRLQWAKVTLNSKHPLSHDAWRHNLGCMNRHPFLICAVAAIIGVGALSGRADAADLGYSPAPRPAPAVYYAPPPSPCFGYEQTFTGALHSARETARLFRSQLRTFHYLKRKRMNDGFVGPDITLNAQLSAEQVDVSYKVEQVMVAVLAARRLNCFSPVRLNLIDNEASRINHNIAQDMLWIDPRTFW